MKWLFDLDNLKPGDILFSRSPYVGKVIAKATKGSYSHVMLYLGGALIHAEPNGVWSKNPQRIIVDDPATLMAYRLKEELSVESLELVEGFARTKVGSLYSIPQAIMTARRPQTAVANEEQFCSRLVAQSFQAAGVNLVADADFCTPNQIAKSPMLVPVVDCIRQANTAEIQFAETDDYNLLLQKETYIWLRKVRKLCERRKLKAIISQNDVGELLIANPTLDRVVCNYIRSTRYLDFFNVDRFRNPWRYDSALFLDKILCQASPVEALAQEKEVNESNIRRHERNLVAAANNMQSHLEYFELELTLTKNILNEMCVWRSAVEQAERHILDTVELC